MSKRALTIGINDYPGTDGDLSGCINDAQDWAAVLGGKGYAVTTLLDAAATRDAMVEKIGDLIAGSTKGDSLIITYSGHGTWVPDRSGDEADGRDEALCPHDIGDGKILLDDDLRGLLDQRPAGVRVVLISDSCHSGSVTRGDEVDLDPGLPRARFLPPASWMSLGALAATRARPSALMGGMTRAGGDLLLAGCRDTEFSWDTQFRGRPNGAFTYYAIKTLHTLLPGASYQQWFRAISHYLPSTRLPQTPQIFGSRTARHFELFS
ncbi:caspase family protein [Denitromonas sp.]|uniref:caspase family protein n=1 Tax=Denitromonas sp. TaxID=2734609 RepID=UPI002AFF1176|nr:caspase family protein [Denitromonas sp.]